MVTRHRLVSFILAIIVIVNVVPWAMATSYTFPTYVQSYYDIGRDEAGAYALYKKANTIGDIGSLIGVASGAGDLVVALAPAISVHPAVIAAVGIGAAAIAVGSHMSFISDYFHRVGAEASGGGLCPMGNDDDPYHYGSVNDVEIVGTYPNRVLRYTAKCSKCGQTFYTEEMPVLDDISWGDLSNIIDDLHAGAGDEFDEGVSHVVSSDNHPVIRFGLRTVSVVGGYNSNSYATDYNAHAVMSGTPYIDPGSYDSSVVRRDYGYDDRYSVRTFNDHLFLSDNEYSINVGDYTHQTENAGVLVGDPSTNRTSVGSVHFRWSLDGILVDGQRFKVLTLGKPHGTRAGYGHVQNPEYVLNSALQEGQTYTMGSSYQSFSSVSSYSGSNNLHRNGTGLLNSETTMKSPLFCEGTVPCVELLDTEIDVDPCYNLTNYNFLYQYNDNHGLQVVDDRQIVDTDNNVLYVPITGNEYEINDWRYDYDNHVIEVNYDKDENNINLTGTIEFGDDNISIDLPDLDIDTELQYVLPTTDTETHVHQYEVTRVDPTCTECGQNIFTCSECGATYTTVISPTGHDWEYIGSDNRYILRINGLPSYIGPVDIYQCTRCGKYYYIETPESEVTDGDNPHTHNWELTLHRDPTCTLTGADVYTCSVCSSQYTEEIPPIGHNYQLSSSERATCTTGARLVYTCTHCSDSYYEYEQALGHDWSEVVHTDPTCTESGSDVRTCERCGETQTTTLDPLGHDWQVTSTVEDTHELPPGTVCPSCSGSNYTSEFLDSTNSYRITCSDCGNRWTVDAVTTLGYIEYTCSRCGATKREENSDDDGLFKTIAKLIRDSIEWVTDKLSDVVDGITSITDGFTSYIPQISPESNAYAQLFASSIQAMPSDFMGVVWFGVVIALVVFVLKKFFM